MKKKCIFILVVIFCFVLNFNQSFAQSYKTGAGLLIDLGDGGTLVGPHIKHFFTEKGAGEGSVLFGDGAVYLQGIYQYTSAISKANGLNWYIGAGPSIAFGDGVTLFGIAAPLGLDYKFGNSPIAASFDWRPRMSFYSGESYFNAGRFGLGIRYILK